MCQLKFQKKRQETAISFKVQMPTISVRCLDWLSDSAPNTAYDDTKHFVPDTHAGDGNGVPCAWQRLAQHGLFWTFGE